MKHVILVTLASGALALAGCAEKTQTAGTKYSGQTWSTPATGFTAPGFKSNDAKAWETQMRRRALGQDEYSRSAAGS